MQSNALDITVETWLELQDIDATSELDNACQIISILRDMPLDEVYELPYDEALATAQSLKALTLAMGKGTEYVMLDEEAMYPVDFNSLEFGAFIDIEALIKAGYKENVHHILAILYRRQLETGTELYPHRLEEYGTWAAHRAGLYLQVKIRDVYATLSSYIGWRQRLLEHYSGLFGGEEDHEDSSDTPERLTSEESKAIAREERIKKWGWELMLWKLAGEDPLKMEDATRMSVTQALNILSMKQELEM